MATQSLEFGYATGQTLAAAAFTTKGDTKLADATSVTELLNATGRYQATFLDLPEADYKLVYFLNSVGVGSEFYSVLLTDATFLPWSETKPSTGGGGTVPSLYSISVKFEDSTGAGVYGAQISIQGSTLAGTSDTFGDAVVGVDANGTYFLDVFPPSGYTYGGGPLQADVSGADVDLGTVVLQEGAVPVPPPSGGWIGA